MSKLKIKGKVSYQNLSGGFWGIKGNDGKDYRPVNMPEQLKKDGAEVTVSAKEMQGGMSIFMWGTPVEITSFSTLK